MLVIHDVDDFSHHEQIIYILCIYNVRVKFLNK